MPKVIGGIWRRVNSGTGMKRNVRGAMKDKLCDGGSCGRKEKHQSGCNEACGGGWIMRGGESEAKVSRK